jgi:excisionase family DNA binding protein
MRPKLLKAGATAWYGSARFLLLRSATEAKVTTDDRWFGVDELAEYLGVSRYTIYSWLTKGTLSGHRVGKFWKGRGLRSDRRQSRGLHVRCVAGREV